MRLIHVILVGALASLGLGGCDVGLSCSEVGGTNGVGVEIARALYVRTGWVRIELCDDVGCQTARQELGRVPSGPVGRGSGATRTVPLERSYPNGRECDGEGYLSGRMRMGAEDRVDGRGTRAG